MATAGFSEFSGILSAALYQRHLLGFEIVQLEFHHQIAPERMKRLSQSKNSAQLWMWLVMEVKSDAVKNNIA